VHHAGAVASSLAKAETAGEPPYYATQYLAGGGPDGQPLVTLEVLFDSPALDQALASLPAGLIQIVPALVPVTD
jgi:hypothetical protein